MKKKVFNIIKFIVSISIGVGLIFWSLKNLDENQKTQVVDAFKNANYKWIYLTILFGFISNVSRTQRWLLLLKTINYNPRFSITFVSVTLMFFANLIFPRLGEVSRCAILAKYEDVPFNKSFGTIVLERIIDFITILFLGLLLILFERERLSIIFDEIFGFIVNKFLLLISVNNIIISIFIIISLIILLRKISKKEEFFLKIKERTNGIWLGLISIKKLEQKWQFLFHSILIWFCYLLMSYFSFKCLVETAHLGMFTAMATLFFGGFAMILTQGGIGAFPIVIQKILSLYMINSVIGLSYGWISWSAQTIFVIIGGILSLLFLSLESKIYKQKE